LSTGNDAASEHGNASDQVDPGLNVGVDHDASKESGDGTFASASTSVQIQTFIVQAAAAAVKQYSKHQHAINNAQHMNNIHTRVEEVQYAKQISVIQGEEDQQQEQDRKEKPRDDRSRRPSNHDHQGHDHRDMDRPRHDWKRNGSHRHDRYADDGRRQRTEDNSGRKENLTGCHLCGATEQWMKKDCSRGFKESDKSSTVVAISTSENWRMYFGKEVQLVLMHVVKDLVVQWMHIVGMTYVNMVNACVVGWQQTVPDGFLFYCAVVNNKVAMVSSLYSESESRSHTDRHIRFKSMSEQAHALLNGDNTSKGMQRIMCIKHMHMKRSESQTNDIKNQVNIGVFESSSTKLLEQTLHMDGESIEMHKNHQNIQRDMSEWVPEYMNMDTNQYRRQVVYNSINLYTPWEVWLSKEDALQYLNDMVEHEEKAYTCNGYVTNNTDACTQSASVPKCMLLRIISSNANPPGTKSLVQAMHEDGESMHMHKDDQRGPWDTTMGLSKYEGTYTGNNTNDSVVMEYIDNQCMDENIMLHVQSCMENMNMNIYDDVVPVWDVNSMRTYQGAYDMHGTYGLNATWTQHALKDIAWFHLVHVLYDIVSSWDNGHLTWIGPTETIYVYAYTRYMQYRHKHMVHEYTKEMCDWYNMQCTSMEHGDIACCKRWRSSCNAYGRYGSICAMACIYVPERGHTLNCLYFHGYESVINETYTERFSVLDSTMNTHMVYAKRTGAQIHGMDAMDMHDMDAIRMSVVPYLFFEEDFPWAISYMHTCRVVRYTFDIYMWKSERCAGGVYGGNAICAYTYACICTCHLQYCLTVKECRYHAFCDSAHMNGSCSVPEYRCEDMEWICIVVESVEECMCHGVCTAMYAMLAVMVCDGEERCDIGDCRVGFSMCELWMNAMEVNVNWCIHGIIGEMKWVCDKRRVINKCMRHKRCHVSCVTGVRMTIHTEYHSTDI
jgi:hypothetical protein